MEWKGEGSISMSGPTSFFHKYMQRGLTRSVGLGSGWLLGSHVPSTGSVAAASNSNPSLPVPSSHFATGTTTPLTAESSFESPHRGVNAGGGGEPVKRKRGRPRKCGCGPPDAKVASATLGPGSAGPSDLAGGGGGGGGEVQKKRRGRPPGSGRKQQLASYGEHFVSSSGSGFTPHLITIQPGEDIASKIMSFAQLGPRAICILSATGSVSTVTLRQSAGSGGTITYEGRFEILSLSGSYLLVDNDGSHSRSGGLSISLSSPDSRIIGGGVGGVVIADSPVQVMMCSFAYSGHKNKSKLKSQPEHNAVKLDSPADDELTCSSPTTQPSQNMNPVLTDWPSTRPLDMMSSPIDIDLTHV